MHHHEGSLEYPVISRHVATSLTTMYLERERTTRLDLPGIHQDQVAGFLARPCRPLAALLSRQRLETVDSNHFVYASRPFSVGTWSIQPKLQLESAWSNSVLHIECKQCTISGLGDWQRAVLFLFRAKLVPEHEACLAHVTARLTLDMDGPLSIVPKPLLRSLAEQALVQALARMEKRCQNGLRKKMLSLNNPE